jgi:hypothetical protein
MIAASWFQNNTDMPLYKQSLSIFQAEYLEKKEINKNTKHNRKLRNSKILI